MSKAKNLVTLHTSSTSSRNMQRWHLLSVLKWADTWQLQGAVMNMSACMQAQARLFKGAFGSPGDGRSKGLWEDTADQQQQHRQSFLEWLWGIVVACLGIFTLSRRRKDK